MKGVYAKDHPRYFRAIGQTQFGREAVDDSVKKKIQDDPNYKPQNKGLQ
jgi:hypothetical protein